MSAMITVFERAIHVPRPLFDLVGSFPIGDPVTQMDNDIWISDGPVEFHIDPTEDDLLTYGVVLRNDIDYLFMFDSCGACDFPVGTLYRLDARILHGTVKYRHEPPGRFGFLAWDMPPSYTMGEFEYEVGRELHDRFRG